MVMQDNNTVVPNLKKENYILDKDCDTEQT